MAHVELGRLVPQRIKNLFPIKTVTSGEFVREMATRGCIDIKIQSTVVHNFATNAYRIEDLTYVGQTPSGRTVLFRDLLSRYSMEASINPLDDRVGLSLQSGILSRIDDIRRGYFKLNPGFSHENYHDTRV